MHSHILAADSAKAGNVCTTQFQSQRQTSKARGWCWSIKGTSVIARNFGTTPIMEHDVDDRAAILGYQLDFTDNTCYLAVI